MKTQSNTRMKKFFFTGLFMACSLVVFSQVNLVSPNKKIAVTLSDKREASNSGWFMKITYSADGKTCDVLPEITMGLDRSDQVFAKELKLLKAGTPTLINETYTALHGKRSVRSNSANEVTVQFENPDKSKLNIIIRAYNDGVTFRYEFPDKKGNFVVNDELTAYQIPDGTRRWLEKFNTANEGLYTAMTDGKTQQEWGYPALFNGTDKNCWFLIHEAGLDRNYCGTKLSNTAKARVTVDLSQLRDDGNARGIKTNHHTSLEITLARHHHRQSGRCGGVNPGG